MVSKSQAADAARFRFLVEHTDLDKLAALFADSGPARWREIIDGWIQAATYRPITQLSDIIVDANDPRLGK